jgi:hypothetical protein
MQIRICGPQREVGGFQRMVMWIIDAFLFRRDESFYRWNIGLFTSGVGVYILVAILIVLANENEGDSIRLLFPLMYYVDVM